ncbi:MAG: rod shape-determining protein RodA [Spirochaetaceae bacterium 4572_59]|nr:MAG: rod shape-determining protein RodA [Spirochaetaceae bacterium 4572_59]
MLKIKLTAPSIFGFDFIIFFAVEFLMVIGIFFIYSSGVNSNGVIVTNEFIKQIIWVSTGTFIMLFFAFMDYRRLRGLALPLYLLTILLMVLTVLFGQVVNGARSWLGIGSLGIQPSEISKLTTILFLSSYLNNNRNRISSLWVFMTAFIIILIPMGIVLMQPDLGTAMVFIPVFLITMFIAGGKKRYILFILFTGILTILFSILPYWEMFIASTKINSMIIFTDMRLMKILCTVTAVLIVLSVMGYILARKPYFYIMFYSFTIFGISYIFSFAARMVLKDYQVMRLIVFMDPQVDPKGAGWNIIQSLTAVGSGGAFGKGFLQGTQSHYRYLPEQSTDFIFSIISEEIGFVGNLVIICLFAIIFWRCLNIIIKSRDVFGSLIAAGMVGMIFFHFMINIGMAIGIMPITGIPLLFLSYGGSSLWTTLLGIGILLSIYHRRYKNTN